MIYLVERESASQADVVRALDVLAELKVQRGMVAEPFQVKIDALMAEMKEATGILDEDVEYVEGWIRDAVKGMGKTVKGVNLMAVWSKGAVTWDGKMLLGMTEMEPKLKAAMKVGEPKVSIKER